MFSLEDMKFFSGNNLKLIVHNYSKFVLLVNKAFHRGSYMSVNVLLNLLNELGKLEKV